MGVAIVARLVTARCYAVGEVMRRTLAVLSCLLMSSSGCGSSDDEVTRARCETLRDHLIELRLANVDQTAAAPPRVTRPMIEVPAGPPVRDEHGHTSPGQMQKMPPPPMSASKIDIASHRAAMTQAFGERFLATCQQIMTPARLKCVLAATDSEKANACSSSAPPQTAGN